MSTPSTVTFADIRRAADAVAEVLPPTPAWSYPALDAMVGCEVVVKHENVQPTGAFKVRGGLALVSAMDPAQLTRGLVTPSTGNHAQSIAYAARHCGTTAVIVVPEDTPAAKIAAINGLGAEVVVAGATVTHSADHARALAHEGGMTYVDPGNTPEVLAGHATAYLELFTQRPDLEAVYVSVGSGTGAAGACVVRDELAPRCRIIGVQSSRSPAAHGSWAKGTIEEVLSQTRHAGLATGRGYALPQSILAHGLHDFLLVDDDAIDGALVLMARSAHTLAEGAGAASLAGLLADQERPDRCAVICTGGNASDDELHRLAAA